MVSCRGWYHVESDVPYIENGTMKCVVICKEGGFMERSEYYAENSCAGKAKS